MPQSEAGTGIETSSGEGGEPGDGGEVISDGGSNIDPDAGEGLDAGPDGGACNMLANDAPPITSACVSAAPVLGGGALVGGTYFLTKVSVLATPNFCSMKFVPTGFKETLSLTVDAQGVGTADTHTSIGGGGARRRTTTLTPSGANQSPLQAASTCPAQPAVAVPYLSLVVAGKQELVMRLPYGTGEGLYRFEKQ